MFFKHLHSKATLFFLLCYFISWGHSGLLFTENKGQWDDRVSARAKTNFGYIYLEKTGFSYLFYDKLTLSREAHSNPDYEIPEFIKAHFTQMKWINPSSAVTVSYDKPVSWHENYFKGKDPSKWASEVKSYTNSMYTNVWSGVDIKLYQYAQYLKYDYYVAPGTDPNVIKWEYKGAEKVYLDEGILRIENSMGSISEQKPVAYQMKNGKELEVKCEYSLENGILGFNFPDGYDTTLELIIDPIIIFSTYTGSTADNWGTTATYDETENAYGAGTVYGFGYPTSPGAFQTTTTSNGNLDCDMGISKFSSDGTTLMYSTYLGGTGQDSPHSMIVNDNDELFILGTTSSLDYPVTVGCFQNNFAGGGAAIVPNGYSSYAGSDIVVTKLNANGTLLMGSTYVGGSDNDGLNYDNTLSYFYGDGFRGEIILDANDNPIIASNTFSNDFPVSVGAPQTSFGGLSDGVIFKLDANLTSMVWGSYFGGTDHDACLGTQVDQNGNIFFTGATRSASLPTGLGAMNPNALGDIDGFVMKLNPTGTAFLGGTYIGTASKDLSYLVQLDDNDDVYLFGISEGNYPISNVLYGIANSHQFIQKLDNNLNNPLWSTIIGSGTGVVNFSPTAFLVNDCGLIYMSGWGGATNNGQAFGNPNVQNANTTTTGLPITPNAFQNSTTGSDFYLAVLQPNASGLLYGSFMGGSSADHVDGGTSRFDKKGFVYHAVCAGCGGNSNFPTSPTAYSTVNGSGNCNMAVFKFGLNKIETIIGLPAPYVCIPNTYSFFNNTIGANQFIWSFGDGDTSYLEEPTHLYLDTGNFEVTLIAIDTNGCVEPDTASIFVDVFAIDDAGIYAVPPICPGDTLQLEAYGGESYVWYPNQDMIGDTTYITNVHPDSTMTYYVIATDSCSTDTASIEVVVFDENVDAGPDAVICLGQSTQLNATGGQSFEWDPDPTLSATNIHNPTVDPIVDTWYYVEVETHNGCFIRDSVFVEVFQTPPQPVISNDTSICLNDSIQLIASGSLEIVWQSNYNISEQVNDTVTVWPTESFTYVAEFINACGSVYDSVEITVIELFPSINADTIICPGDTAILYAGGGDNYLWSPNNNISDSDSSTTSAYPDQPTTYFVNISNGMGCSAIESVFVDIFSLPYVNAGPDLSLIYGSSIEILGASSADSIYWWPPDSLSCYTCLSTSANPTQQTHYILYAVDTNGCINSDTMTIYLDPVLYVPNAFTPNGDGTNDVFYAIGREINTFEIFIFDRWGEVVYNSTDINEGWDGSFKGRDPKPDVYVWKIKFTDYINPYAEHEKVGHVTIVK